MGIQEQHDRPEDSAVFQGSPDQRHRAEGHHRLAERNHEPEKAERRAVLDHLSQIHPQSAQRDFQPRGSLLPPAKESRRDRRQHGEGFTQGNAFLDKGRVSQTVIFLKEHHLGSPEELEQQIDDLQSAHDEKKASIRQAQNRMKEINRQRQAIRDYRRTKEIYTQFKESGWSAKFYQEHRAEIEAHKKAQAVYELHDGKLPTLKELTAEYVALKEQLDAYKPDLAELKSKLTDLKHIRYNYKILIRDIPQTDQYHRKGDRIER